MPRVYPPKKQRTCDHGKCSAPAGSRHINLTDLRKIYGKGLKPEKQLEIEDMICAFASKAYLKYALGAREHKNNLTVEVAKKELLEEAIDTFIYAMKVNEK